MTASNTDSRTGIRYQPDEASPPALSLGLGLQLAILTVAVPILFPTVVMRSAGAFASREGWNRAMADRLEAAAEETLLAVVRDDEPAPERAGRRLRLVAYREDDAAVLEFVVAPGEENLEDRMALIGGETDETPDERDVSLRLLRHLASSVRHQRYHDIDIVTVRVKAPGPNAGAQS